MQLNNSSNANNLYNSVESSDLSSDKTIAIDIELDSGNDNDSEKDDDNQKKTSIEIELNNDNDSDNEESRNRENENEQESTKKENYMITNNKSYSFSIDLLVINYNNTLFIASNNINTSTKNNSSFINLIKIYFVASTIIKMYLASMKTNSRTSNYRKIDFVFSSQSSLFILNCCFFIRLTKSHCQNKNEIVNSKHKFDELDTYKLRSIIKFITIKNVRTCHIFNWHQKTSSNAFLCLRTQERR